MSPKVKPAYILPDWVEVQPQINFKNGNTSLEAEQRSTYLEVVGSIPAPVPGPYFPIAITLIRICRSEH